MNNRPLWRGSFLCDRRLLQAALYRRLSCAPKRDAARTYHADRETDEKRWKPMKASIVGGFMRGSGMGESMRATWRGDGNPICRHFCADIVRLFISTPNKIERTRQIVKDRVGKKRGWEEGEKESIPLYCRIGILPRIRQRAFSAFFFYLRRTPRERPYNSTVCIGHTVDGWQRLHYTLRISPVSIRRPQSRYYRRKFLTDGR